MALSPHLSRPSAFVTAALSAALLLSGCQADPSTSTGAASSPTISHPAPAGAARSSANPTAAASDPAQILASAPELPESSADSALASAAACGIERQAVKTGRDSAAAQVDVSRATDTTVAALGAYSAPDQPGSRVQGPETTVWTVHATLTAYKREADSDYHLALVDGQGSTMIVELADPGCLGSSVWAKQIAAARATFDGAFRAGSSFRRVSVPVTVTGVGFFDKLHGQRGAAPNGIELHPVLALKMG